MDREFIFFWFNNIDLINGDTVLGQHETRKSFFFFLFFLRAWWQTCHRPVVKGTLIASIHPSSPSRVGGSCACSCVARRFLLQNTVLFVPFNTLVKTLDRKKENLSSKLLPAENPQLVGHYKTTKRFTRTSRRLLVFATLCFTTKPK